MNAAARADDVNDALVVPQAHTRRLGVSFSLRMPLFPKSHRVFLNPEPRYFFSPIFMNPRVKFTEPSAGQRLGGFLEARDDVRN